jgi:integrase/recombinase XerD
MVWSPSFRSVVRPGCDVPVYEVGHDLVDGFLEFVAARARPNTVRAYAHDLKVFFDVVNKEPADVVPADVLAFVSAQRRSRPGAENVVRISDGSGGCRRRRSGVGWRRCRASTAIWSLSAG